MTTEASKATTDAGGLGIRLVRRLVVINLGLVALQAVSAGFLMSGYAPGPWRDGRGLSRARHAARAARRAEAGARGSRRQRRRGGAVPARSQSGRSEEHTSELQSLRHLVCRLLLEKK